MASGGVEIEYKVKVNIDPKLRFRPIKVVIRDITGKNYDNFYIYCDSQPPFYYISIGIKGIDDNIAKLETEVMYIINGNDVKFFSIVEKQKNDWVYVPNTFKMSIEGENGILSLSEKERNEIEKAASEGLKRKGK